ncbi:hypothetical protein [Actinomycetospora flava]|uniref:Uncharacterized protein n=1 Tax=Actinomycetospora flava TaxID=3129232 RepID=A0ABU8MAJ6_9PSEU
MPRVPNLHGAAVALSRAQAVTAAAQAARDRSTEGRLRRWRQRRREQRPLEVSSETEAMLRDRLFT